MAGSLSSLEFLPGRNLPVGAIVQAVREGSLSFSGVTVPISLFYLLVGLLWMVLFISIIAFIISSEIRRETIRRVIRYTILILLLHGLARALPPLLPLPNEAVEAGRGDELPSDAPQEPLPSPPEFVIDPPAWLVGGVSLLLLVMAAAGAWFVWRQIRRPKRREPLERLTQKARQALDDLQAGVDMKDAITRCYHDMSQILSQTQGVERRRAMTPREFERFLAGSGFDDEHIRRLTGLFEQVRYSRRSPGRAEEQEARACLTAIVQAYGPPS